MTTCLTGVCGTGEPLVLPNDPSNNSILTATSAYGGIDLSWTLPAQNSHAIAHVGVFRGTTNVFANAIPIAMTANNYYRDNVGPGILYYYWIQIVSINGTYADPIGPASAIALDKTQQTLEELTGLIDKGVLSNELKNDIDKIALNYDELLDEIANRIAGNAALSAALEDVQNGLVDSVALVNQEITTRTEGQNALAQQMNIVAAANESNAAAIIDEQTARVSADEALATDVTALYAVTDNNAAAIIAEQNARTTQDTALANSITTVQATLGSDIASARTELSAEITVVDGKTVAIGSRWTAIVDGNGLVGGFGVYNDGSTVEAGFNVDKFWIGRTIDKVKPFIIDAGTVFIDKAMIRNADIGTLSIAGNAVTVPTTAKQIGSLAGTGSYENICGIVVSNLGNNEPMSVVLIAGGVSGYSSGLRSVSFKIEQEFVGTINEVANISADYVTTPTMMGYATIPANNVGVFSFYWKGADSTVTISGTNIIALGVKR